MSKKLDYLEDIAEIRSMMEKSSKFLSLSGWSGALAGIYALAGAGIAYFYFNFNPDQILYNTSSESLSSTLPQVILIAVVVLILALGTAILLSRKHANEKGEPAWNATSRRLLANMAVPLVSGGVLLIILTAKGILGLLAPMSMIFYGLAIYNGSKFTYDVMKYLGLIQVGLGLIGCWFVEFGMLLWAIGFGVVHIIYGVYMHFRYER